MARLGSQNNPGMLTRADADWKTLAAERENNEIELQFLQNRQRREEQLAAEAAAQDLVQAHFNPGTGKFVSPQFNILEAHQRLVSEPRYELTFSPRNYPDFDAIVAEKAEVPGLSDKDHPDYERYAPLRRNIAVVRNVVLNSLFPDGKFNEDDKNDAIKLEMVPVIAENMGESLKYGKFWLRRPWTVHVNIDEANVDGAGAAKLYEGLLKVQNGFSIYNVRGMLPGHDNTDWGLPPVVDTPFSPANMAAHLPKGAYLTAEKGDEPQEIRDELRTATALMNAADTVDHNAKRLRSVDTLEKPVLDESVELGREILRKLRIQFGAVDQETGMQQPGGDKIEQAGMIAKLSDQYRDYMAAACCANPGICENPEVVTGNEAMGKLAYVMKRLALDEMNKAGDAAGQQQLTRELAVMPENWKNLQGESFITLLDKVDRGYEHAARALAQEPFQNQTGGFVHTQTTVQDQQVVLEEKKKQEGQQQELTNIQLIQEQERRLTEELAKLQAEERRRLEKLALGGVDVVKLKKMGVAQTAFEDPKAPKRSEEAKTRTSIAPEEIEAQLAAAEEPHLHRR